MQGNHWVARVCRNYHLAYDYIREKLKGRPSRRDWRELWIDILAWSAGFDVFKKKVQEKRFPAYLTRQKKKVFAYH